MAKAMYVTPEGIVHFGFIRRERKRRRRRPFLFSFTLTFGARDYIFSVAKFHLFLPRIVPFLPASMAPFLQASHAPGRNSHARAHGHDEPPAHRGLRGGGSRSMVRRRCRPVSRARVSSDGQAQPVSGFTCEAMTSSSVRADPWDLLEDRTCATVDIDMDDSPLPGVTFMSPGWQVGQTCHPFFMCAYPHQREPSGTPASLVFRTSHKLHHGSAFLSG